ncbi:MAG: hypothetical protein IT561_01980 [Alphaproteobacteria bacterium]|nr:hypothetical protein [Alphaproteobacteria bacterium]
MKLSDLKTEPRAESEGVAVEILPGLVVTVRSTATPAYRNAQARLLRPLARVVAAGMPIPAEKQDEITARLLAEEIVAGWQGVADDAGQPIPFSPERAAEIFRDPACRQFRDLVFEAASTAETFRRQRLADIAKN